jgi:hypothetical protein
MKLDRDPDPSNCHAVVVALIWLHGRGRRVNPQAAPGSLRAIPDSVATPSTQQVAPGNRETARVADGLVVVDQAEIELGPRAAGR